MSNTDRDKWYRTRKMNLDKRLITRRMRRAEGATVRHAHRFLVNRWSNVLEVRKHIIIWMIIVGSLIAAAGLQFIWYQQNYRTTAPSLDGTYAEAALGPIDTLHPLFSNTSAEQSVSYLMFSRLLTYDRTGNLKYDLATDISVNEDETVYTVKIRPDVKWHDGASLKARDIAFTVELMKHPATRSTITGWRDVGVEVIDDTTVQFTLQFPYAAFRHALNFPIVPRHILGEITPGTQRESDFSNNPVGSGPFNFRFTQNIDTASGRKVIHMARNDSYYAGKAKLSRFQMHVYNDREAIVTALTRGEVNAAADLSSVEVDNLNPAKYEVIHAPITSGLYALFNTESDLLKDKTLRQALNLATDTTAIREQLRSDTPPLYLPFINGQVKGDGLPAPQQHDSSKAEALLIGDGWVPNASGVREKDGKELRLSAVTLKNSESESILEELVRQWREVGIVVDTQVVDPSDVLEDVTQNILRPRNYDVLIYQLNIGADPDVYAYWHSSQATPQGFNLSNYKNAISDDALASARSRGDAALRNAKYITFARQWASDVPAIALYQLSVRYVHTTSARSVVYGTVLVSPINRYVDVLDWSVGKRTVYKTP